MDFLYKNKIYIQKSSANMPEGLIKRITNKRMVKL